MLQPRRSTRPGASTSSAIAARSRHRDVRRGTHCRSSSGSAEPCTATACRRATTGATRTSGCSADSSSKPVRPAATSDSRHGFARTRAESFSTGTGSTSNSAVTTSRAPARLSGKERNSPPARRAQPHRRRARRRRGAARPPERGSTRVADARARPPSAARRRRRRRRHGPSNIRYRADRTGRRFAVARQLTWRTSTSASTRRTNCEPSAEPERPARRSSSRSCPRGRPLARRLRRRQHGKTSSSAAQTRAKPIIPSSIPVPLGPAADSRVQRTPKRAKSCRGQHAVRLRRPELETRSTGCPRLGRARARRAGAEEVRARRAPGGRHVTRRAPAAVDRPGVDASHSDQRHGETGRQPTQQEERASTGCASLERWQAATGSPRSGTPRPAAPRPPSL